MSHIRRLRKLLSRRGHTREDADDLIQEAFLRLHVFRQKNEVRQEEAFLVRSVLNLAIDSHRRGHGDLYVEERPEEMQLLDLAATPDVELAAQQRLEEVGRVLEKLKWRTREVLLMRRVDGMSFPQIAEVLGISVSAVEKHLARAVMAIMDFAEKTGEQK